MPSSAGGAPPKDPETFLNMKLVRAQGGNRYDPMHPDHLRYLMANGTAPDRFVAAVTFHTLSFGHPCDGYGNRSPWAVDEHGKVLKLKDFAEYFEWHIETARKVKEDAVASGRIREDEHGRFWLCARIETTKENAAPARKADDDLPDYIRQALAKLSSERREQILQCYRVGRDYYARVRADAIAGARKAETEFERRLFAEADIALKTCEKKANGNEQAATAQLALTGVPDIILRYVPDSVHSGNGTSYTAPENGSQSPSTPISAPLPSNGNHRASSETETEKYIREEVGRYVGAETPVQTPDRDEPTHLPPQSISEAQDRYHPVKEFLKTFTSQIHRAPRHEEIAKVTRALDGAPVEQLQARVELRQSAGLKITGYGIFVGLAEECATAKGEWNPAALAKSATNRKPPTVDRNTRAVQMMIDRRLKGQNS